VRGAWHAARRARQRHGSRPREATAEGERADAERTEAQLSQQADRLRAESDARVAKEVAAAREGAEREARERCRIREEGIGSGFPKSLLTDLKDRVTL
jgi:hypothetical protein